MLVAHPQLGQLRPELHFNGLRSFVLTPYVIFYLPTEDGIDIIRVLHGRTDISNIWATSGEEP